MDISINLTDGVPIYRQIVNQVKYLVASGLLKPGEELPPIRTLALQLKVTPNTIVKAYGELEISGVIHKRHGSGTFVSEGRQQLALRELRRVGYLSEERELPEWMRIDELMRYTQAFHPTWDRSYARELLETFALDPSKK